ncbi:hypothetical protein LTS12_027591, partial [Elasticomyces elasticus]
RRVPLAATITLLSVGLIDSVSPHDRTTVPVKVKMVLDDEYSIRVPLETCKMNNTDFDGDELWLYKPMSQDAIKELEEAWDRIWNESGVTNIKQRMGEIVLETGGDTSIDAAMYSTMPLEDMIDRACHIQRPSRLRQPLAEGIKWPYGALALRCHSEVIAHNGATHDADRLR